MRANWLSKNHSDGSPSVSFSLSGVAVSKPAVEHGTDGGPSVSFSLSGVAVNKPAVKHGNKSCYSYNAFPIRETQNHTFWPIKFHYC